MGHGAMSLDQAGSGEVGGGSDGVALPVEIKHPIRILPPELWNMIFVLFGASTLLLFMFFYPPKTTLLDLIFNMILIVFNIVGIITSRSRLTIMRNWCTNLSNEGVSRNFGFAGLIPWASLSACEFRKFWGPQHLRFYVLPDAYKHITMTLRPWTWFQSARLRKSHFDVYFEHKFPKQNAESIAAL